MEEAAPKPIWAVSFLGLLGFPVPAMVYAYGPDRMGALALTALITWSAVVLAFLGGVRWGLESSRPVVRWPRLLASTISPIAGWLLFAARHYIDVSWVVCGFLVAFMLQWLFDYAPPHLHIVLCSRAALPLSLARLDSQGLVATLDLRDLRFSPEESEAYLRDQLGEISPRDARRLHELTDGWIAGLQLFALDIKAKQGTGTPGFFPGSTSTLRDASAYNVQFRDGRPLFIDTLSFGRHVDGQPWAAYRQFCEHFLVPLALMAHTDVRCGLLLRQFIDGVPLDLGSRLLPLRTRVSPSLALHVHLHARAQRRYEHADVKAVAGGRRMSSSALRNFVTTVSGTLFSR